MLEDRHIAVQVLALEGVGDHGLVLHAHQIVKACLPQGQDRALKLPGGGVRAGHRKVPGDIVLENRGRVGMERFGPARQFEETLVVLDHGLGPRVE